MTATIRSSHALGLALNGQPILIKFFVGDPKNVPAGIPRRERASDQQMDRKHAAEAGAGEEKLAMPGRVRPGRVDTGIPVYQHEERVRVASMRSLLAHLGYWLVDAHYYVKPDRKGNTAVIVMFLSLEGTAVKLPRSTMDGLRKLARENVWKAHVWDNGHNPSTINFTERSQGKPYLDAVVRDGYVKLVPAKETNAEVLEGEEDQMIVSETLARLEASFLVQG